MEAAKSRVQSLNPLVTVETHTDSALLEGERLSTLVQSVDLVCVTDWDRDVLVSDLPSRLSIISTDVVDPYEIRINDVCRQQHKPFYAGGSYGLLGYIFCDLLQHDYIAPWVRYPPCVHRN